MAMKLLLTIHIFCLLSLHSAQQTFDAAILSPTAQSENTSNLLLEVFQSSSSKWSTTCGAPQLAQHVQEDRPHNVLQNYEDLNRLNSSTAGFNPDVSSWNGGVVSASCSGFSGECRNNQYRAMEVQDQYPLGPELLASLDPVPLPSPTKRGAGVNNVYVTQPGEQQSMTAMANARTREYLLGFIQQHTPHIQNPTCVDPMFFAKQMQQPGVQTSLASAFDARWVSLAPPRQDAAPLPSANTWCLPADEASYESLQKLFLTPSCNPTNQQNDLNGSNHSSSSSSSSQNYPTMDSPLDEIYLNPFHCFLRKQIVIFEATHDDIGKIQGRNKGLALNQVGLGCRFCTPYRNTDRCRGATYHPTRLNTIYQTAQNLVKNHFFRNCPHMPEEVKEELRQRASRITKSNRGGGKQYWSNVLQISGVVERDGGLFFA